MDLHDLEAEAHEGEHDEHVLEPNEHWLVSYADLMTLLFGFFAMLYLMAGTPEKINPSTATQTTTATETATEVVQVPAPPPPISIPPPQAPEITESSGQSGGNRGSFIFFLLPPELLAALAAAFAIYFLLYLIGFKNRIEPLNPNTGPARVAPRMRGTGLIPIPNLREALQEEDFLELGGEEFAVEAAPAPTDEKWLISYADLMTLLFGFFAMLYLMGPNYEAVKASMETTFAKKEAPPPLAAPNVPVVPMPSLPPPEPPKPIIAPPAVVTETAIATEVSSSTAVATSTLSETRTETSVNTETKIVPVATKTIQELEEEDRQRVERLKAKLSKTGVRIKNQDNGEGGGGEGGKPGSGKGTTGKGGTGVGGGHGGGVGKGNNSGSGSTVCSDGAVMPYQPTCWGNGFFGCLNTQEVINVGGTNGEGGALEFYCVGGLTRICLTWERCPWRTGTSNAEDYPNGYLSSPISPDSMFCSPMGLNIATPNQKARMASCRGSADCGFKHIDCDGMGRVYPVR